jgi:hypothetical protein
MHEIGIPNAAELKEADEALSNNKPSGASNSKALLGWIVILAVATVFFVVFRGKSEVKRNAVPVATYYLLWGGIALLAIPIIVLVRRKPGTMHQPGLIGFSELGLEFRAGPRTMTIKWRTLVGQLETPATIILQCDQQRGYVIPRRCLTPDAQMNLQRWYNSAKEGRSS